MQRCEECDKGLKATQGGWVTLDERIEIPVDGPGGGEQLRSRRPFCDLVCLARWLVRRPEVRAAHA